jgi:hypothetical protein
MPAPIAYNQLSIGAGSYANSGIGILSTYYGSGIFGSGYAFAPLAIAQGTDAFTQQNAMIAVIATMYSQAQSANGIGAGSLASLQATAGGYGFFNSGSVTRFLVLGPSASQIATGNILVTLLVVSAPPIIDVVG